MVKVILRTIIVFVFWGAVFGISSSVGGQPSNGCFTEQSASSNDAFDLMYESVLLNPTANGTSYNAEIQQISQLPIDPSGDINLARCEDASSFVKSSGSVYGSSLTGFYMGSNGYITFTEGDQQYPDTLANHFDTLRVSGLFRDLNPTAGGQVSRKQLTNRVVVTWENVPRYGASKSNTFQIALYYDGSIQLSWENIDALRGIVGLSKGLGVPTDFQETDFSLLTPPPPPASDYLVEHFTGGADEFDLEYKSVMFSLSSSGMAYGVEVTDITQLPTDPAGGTNLALGDDTFVSVKLTSPATVSIYGSSFTSFYVGSNGYITFTEGDQGYSESLEDHFDTLRVSALFRDLNPSAGGQVSWRQLNDRVVITWQNIREYGSNNPNAFQIKDRTKEVRAELRVPESS